MARTRDSLYGRVIQLTLLALLIAPLGPPAAAADLEGFALWNLNYGDFLVDEGKFLEALDSYASGFDASREENTRARALLQRGMVLATYLNDIDEALATYQLLEESYPPLAQTALYRRALILFDNGRYRESIDLLAAYQQKYPAGSFLFQVEVLLDQARASVQAVPPKEVPLLIADDGPVVRVLVSKQGRQKTCGNISLAGENLRLTVNSVPVCQTKALACIASQGKLQITAGCGDSGKNLDAKEIMISSPSPIQMTIPGKQPRLRGEINLIAEADELYAVNLVPMELYLRSVVPRESYPSWPEAALMAQTVAARTYAVNRMQGRKKWVYDVTDDTWDQVYGGISAETVATDRAIDKCRGMVLVTSGGDREQPIQTYFTANSGGYTADPGAIFNLRNTPYLQSQPDRASLSGKMATWTRRKDVREIEEILRQRKIEVGRLQNISAEEIGPSGRILRVRIEGSEHTVVLKSRPLLTGGGFKLPDILVDISRSGDTFLFRGRGFGHGLGYSQWGGADMAEQGKSHAEILAFYYPGAELKKLW